MPDKAVRQPVSGEIVTCSGGDVTAIGTDVIDADFTTIEPAGHAPHSPGQRREDATSPAGLGSLSAPAARPRRGQRAGPAFWTGGIGVAAVAFWVSGGHAVIDLPGLRLGPAEPVTVTRFESRIDASSGGPVLFVEGELTNSASREVDLPMLAVDVSTGQGVTRYLIAEWGGSIAARSQYRFTGRLAPPPGEIGSVKVVVGGRSARSTKGV